MKISIYIAGILLLTSCEADHSPTRPKSSIISREHIEIYQARVNPDWKWIEIDGEEDLSDTKKPIATFLIDNTIRITVHNFPVGDGQAKIPPNAQIARWMGQIGDLNPVTSSITPVAWSGYSGFYFEGEGLIENSPKRVLGWALALSSRNQSRLTDPQKRADVTIKAVGSQDEIGRHSNEIAAFAKSFELIEEMP